MEIAKADTPEAQRELLKAFETKQLDVVAIRMVKRLMDKRRFLGKKTRLEHLDPQPKAPPTVNPICFAHAVWSRQTWRVRIFISIALTVPVLGERSGGGYDFV
jgi:hypothetical protein